MFWGFFACTLYAHCMQQAADGGVCLLLLHAFQEERKRRRAERFGILSEEEKLQKRLQRFAGSATA